MILNESGMLKNNRNYLLFDTSILGKGVSTIRKIIIAIIIIGMVVISLFVLKPFRSEPPTPTITAANKEIATTQGSFCWDGLFSAQCVDKIYTDPLDMAKKHKPTVVSPNDEIKIHFKKELTPKTLEIEKWIDKDNIENIVLKNDSIIAPKEKGVYVFHILAYWEQGDGHYAFSVEVK